MEGLKDRGIGEQIDRRSEGMREEQKNRRAEGGKDGWGGEKERREVARVMDSYTVQKRKNRRNDCKKKSK